MDQELVQIGVLVIILGACFAAVLRKRKKKTQEKTEKTEV